jgi:hypothetical protein
MYNFVLKKLVDSGINKAELKEWFVCHEPRRSVPRTKAEGRTMAVVKAA